jgi:NAD(P)-dependent dehydrogenase (short-subunit alcohol dehydrogenase family)
MDNRFLTDKVAIVTGASRNLGRGIAVTLAQRGASVAVHYHRAESKSDAVETGRLVEAEGGRALLVEGDLASADTPTAIFDRTSESLGGVDILVNNAGRIVKKPIAAISREDFEGAYALNARAPFLLMQQAAARMRDGGRVINIGTSILGMSVPFYGVYAGSKASLEHLTRDLALQVRSRGITVNTVAPGALDTPFFHAAETPESVAFIEHVTGGLGRVDDVVPVIEFLTHPGSHWLTGQTLFVNGGLLTR